MATKLEDLLGQADESAPRPRTLPAEVLLKQVQQRVGRRRRFRRTVAVAGVILAVGLAGLSFREFSPSRRPDNRIVGSTPVAPAPGITSNVPVVDQQQVRAELASLDREVRQHQAIVRRLEAFEIRQCAQATLANTTDPAARIDEQADRAALILFTQGQRYQDEMNLKPAAVQAYRQAATLFPQTQWGQSARLRLASMGG